MIAWASTMPAGPSVPRTSATAARWDITMSTTYPAAVTVRPRHKRVPPSGVLGFPRARASAAIDRLTAANGGRDIVAVAHAGSIRAALALALDLDPWRGLAVQIDNLSLTRLEYVPGRLDMGHANAWRVVTVNQPPR